MKTILNKNMYISQDLPGKKLLHFQYTDFDFNKLVSLKKEKGLKVGLGIPVKNEEDTLEDVIMHVNAHGISKGIIDKVAIFDSSSTDTSKNIANSYNIDFITDSDFANSLGLKQNVDWKSGKGFNLWASVNYFKDYDILMWIDADIDLKPRFIYGVLGPLITNDNVQFSKGTYERDMGDNRVTRYTVDPLLGIFFPEAGQISDPLCGFFGGRVDLLKKIKFTTGYSVESATLIHTLMSVEDYQVAQTNLGKLKNRRHDDFHTGSIGANIAKTILDLSVEYNRINGDIRVSEHIIQRDCSEPIMKGRLVSDYQDIVLPPMINYLK